MVELHSGDCSNQHRVRVINMMFWLSVNNGKLEFPLLLVYVGQRYMILIISRSLNSKEDQSIEVYLIKTCQLSTEGNYIQNRYNFKSHYNFIDLL